jgi:hypothetical protein
MASTQLRLRGVTGLQLAVATASLAPLGYVAYTVIVKQVAVANLQLLGGLSLLVALLPWLSRGMARANYRASVDDIALHFRGEALPFRAVKAVHVHRSWRRTLLQLERSETIEMWLLLEDAFAGKLAPLDALISRLEKAGVDVTALGS